MRHPGSEPEIQPGQLIATFGQARLIQTLTKSLRREYELVGGSPADRAEAQKWITTFMSSDPVRGLAPTERQT